MGKLRLFVTKIKFSQNDTTYEILKNHKERPPKKRENRWAASQTISSKRGGVEGLMILNHKAPIRKCQITNELYIAHNKCVTNLYIEQAKSFEAKSE